MLTDSVNHYISAFRFPDTADVTRYVPKFNVSNYGQRIRRLLSGSDRVSSTSSTPEVISPDEIFLTPTSSEPTSYKLKCSHDNVSCLVNSGIPGDSYDNTENVQKKILKHATESGVTLCAADIDKCHRLGKPKGIFNRKVIVKFNNSAARQRVYLARKTFGNGIFVQENLTRLRQQLGFEARQLVRAQTLEKTWVAGCKVFGSMPGSVQGASKSIHIKDMSVIQAIKDGKLPFVNNT